MADNREKLLWTLADFQRIWLLKIEITKVSNQKELVKWVIVHQFWVTRNTENDVWEGCLVVWKMLTKCVR